MSTEEQIRTFQKYMEGPLKLLLTKLYPSYMESYMRYRLRVGPQCPICKSAARTLYASELKRNPDFQLRMISGDWSNYG